ncbi:DUF4080 domain-containing protein [Pontiellaceae bacterium B12219]|nr:DUF4080 domain-containing protein [Pontiellaceae bacterium B12219]
MNPPKPSEIIFAAFNARYAHTSFGARYLLANMGELKAQSLLLEYDLQVQPRVAVEKILSHQPKIILIGCYIWNIDLVTKVAALLKKIRPEIRLILGGPEISYETEQQEIFQYADYVVCGEGETEVPKLCRSLLEASDAFIPPASSRPRRIIQAEMVDVSQIELPYDLYTDEDLKHRAIYVEASRGCPFRCEYCMSSLDPCVRYFPEDKLFPAFGKLIDRGALGFKFVDRSFNIDIAFALKVLAFFKERYRPGMMLHFEVIPSQLPDELMEAVADCPPGMLQFEVGIQTFNEAVAHRIQRPLDIEKIEINMRRLRDETGVHIHSDLIAGLPGEDLKSFEAGFNRLLALRPQEIQLGILKRLRGAPIDRHSNDWNMLYSSHAPYEILSTSLISFQDMQRIQRFARYWNLVVNNGQFLNTAPLIWQGRQDGGDTPAPVSPASSGLPETTGFNPHQKILQTQRKNYPHWTQDGCIYFVTFRLADSIPQARIKEYEELRRKWEEHHQPPYSEREQEQFNDLFSERINDWLDEGAGSCLLRNPDFSQIVADALLHFDGTRYQLGEWVIMPNHVHVLVKPLGEHQLSELLHSWKSFSSNQINRVRNLTGKLWQKEYYDHIVRDVDELLRIRKYIRDNPEKADIRVSHSSSLLEAGGTPVPPASSRPGDAPPASSSGLPHSPFAAFMRFSDWLYAKTDTTGNLHVVRLAKLLMEFLTLERKLDDTSVAEALWTDYQRGNRPDVPGFLKKFGFEKRDTEAAKASTPMPRQNRHLQN